MKTVVLRSCGAGAADGLRPEYVLALNTAFACRVLGNLLDEAGFCTACQDQCTACRRRYRRPLHSSIAAVVDFPAELPYLLEAPASYVPAQMPSHDVLLALCIHEQILLEILKAGRRFGTKGVVVPLEATDWITPAARRAAEEICAEQHIEIAFPKPFCSFDPNDDSVLGRFRRHFRIGAPEVDLVIRDGIIEQAQVNVTAACGATCYIARWLEGRSLDDDLKHDVVSRRLHSYPCTASMEWDDELGDTPLHISGQMHYRILDSITEETLAREQFVQTPLGLTLPKPVPIQENLRIVADAKQKVISLLAEDPAMSLVRLRQDAKVSPAALNTALLELKKGGRIHIRAGTVRLGPTR